MPSQCRIGAALIVVLALSGLAAVAQAQPANARVLRLCIPFVNSFYQQPSGEPDTKASTGFWGIGAGLMFRHSGSQYLGLAASVAIDYEVPIPAPIDYVGEDESMAAYAIDLTNSHVWRRFSLGYGLAYGSNRWRRDFYPAPGALPTAEDRIEHRNHSLGLVFPVGYALDDRFSLGLTYRPYLYRLGTDAGFHYEHVVSVDVAWILALP